jgi:hypothetical protein
VAVAVRVIDSWGVRHQCASSSGVRIQL